MISPRSLAVCGMLISLTPVLAADLSKYRAVVLGSDLATVARQTGISLSETRIIQRRPGLIQELLWRPQSLGSAAPTDPVQEVILGFFDGRLFRIAVNYDRYDTEGLTAGDIIGALSAEYGAAKPFETATAKVSPEGYYGDQEKTLARWEDSEHRLELIRISYGPAYKLVGTLKALEGPVQAAILEASRLDAQEAPQREAALDAIKDEAERAKLEKARLTNKPNFRP